MLRFRVRRNLRSFLVNMYETSVYDDFPSDDFPMKNYYLLGIKSAFAVKGRHPKSAVA